MTEEEGEKEGGDSLSSTMAEGKQEHVCIPATNFILQPSHATALSCAPFVHVSHKQSRVHPMGQVFRSNPRTT